MRPLEMTAWWLMLPALFALCSVLPVSLGMLAAAVSCILLVVAAIWQGAYWQLVPLYLSVVLCGGLLASLLVGIQQPRWLRVTAGGLAATFLVLTAAFTYVLPMFRLPKPTGAYAVGTRILHLVDPKRMETHAAGLGRRREIMVQIWYPATPKGQPIASYRQRSETTYLSSYMGVLWTHSYSNAPVALKGAPFPVLLFNPAWTGQRTQNTNQVEDLASHGFVVVAIDHTYNSGPTAFPDGRVIGLQHDRDIDNFNGVTLQQQIAYGDAEVHVQADDDILALDYLAKAAEEADSPWFHRVDTNNAGAFGHSFGGAVSAQASYQDPRIKAAINLDGWVFGDVATHGLEKPFMIMYEDYPAPTQSQLNSSDHQTRLYAELCVLDLNHMMRTLQQNSGYLLKLLGSRHNNFRDRALYSPVRRLSEAGTISPQLAHRIVEAYTLQFFSHYLFNQPAPLLMQQGSPFKEVQFEHWPKQDAPSH